MARIVVAAPGRGSYNRTELRYLTRFSDHPDYQRRLELAARADDLRKKEGLRPVTDLDQTDQYRASLHLPGENASSLIFTCSAADMALLREHHEICATLGNSMGWYTTLFTSGAFPFEATLRLVQTLASYQKEALIGGQVIYPVVDNQWRPDQAREQQVQEVLGRLQERENEFRAGLSIRLGGYVVLSGTRQAVEFLLQELPPLELGKNRYPFQLPYHAAFHTPLMRKISRHALLDLDDLPWDRQPEVPMIDGQGRVWRPCQVTGSALRHYTLATQVLEPFDFTSTLRVALREYNPDHVVLLGPGDTLGGAIAQVMIGEGWRGVKSRDDFLAAQDSDAPPLLAMNRPEQARLLYP